MNPALDALLTRTNAVMQGAYEPSFSNAFIDGKVYVGVDLGTAYTVLVVLDAEKKPIAGDFCFSQVVRDGLVVDFDGAIQLVRQMKAKVEARLGFELVSAASGYPPGVPREEVRATGYVLEAAELNCTGLIDEPSAANHVLQIQDGAIVDVGGGTTGIAIIVGGKIIFTADEPSGGTHFSLVIAGAKNLTFEQAEEIKKDARQQPILFPVVRPVMEKVAAIILKHIQGYPVSTIYLVGGTCSYPGMAEVIESYTGIKTILPGSPMFITPLGIAMYNE